MTIKLIGTDIDGVWTDAKMYYNDKGECMKSFSTYDGMAVEILRKEKIPVVIMTSENSKSVLKRAKKLKIKEVYIGEKEKLKRLLNENLGKKYIKEIKLNWRFQFYQSEMKSQHSHSRHYLNHGQHFLPLI